MNANPVALLDESQCQRLESFLVDRIYEFNSQTTGYFDGRLLAGSIHNDAGEIIAGFSGHTWGGCCEISHLWVIETMRGQGLGRRLLEAAEAEALRRGCGQVVLSTHSFQAPEFYKRLGYQEVFEIEGRPRGHSNIIYIKQFRREHELSGV
jgi:GNAT superfamily N-acetyltransferase